MTADLVKELRADALFLACNDLARAKETAPWKAADALSERSTLQAELVELRKRVVIVDGVNAVLGDQYAKLREERNAIKARAEAAESSLTIANERLATLRNEVLEEAARVCDEEIVNSKRMAVAYLDRDKLEDDNRRICNAVGADSCARMIRALK